MLSMRFRKHWAADRLSHFAVRSLRREAYKSYRWGREAIDCPYINRTKRRGARIQNAIARLQRLQFSAEQLGESIAAGVCAHQLIESMRPKTRAQIEVAAQMAAIFAELDRRSAEEATAMCIEVARLQDAQQRDR